jgi:hypothetical protein
MKLHEALKAIVARHKAKAAAKAVLPSMTAAAKGEHKPKPKTRLVNFYKDVERDVE